ncbi:MAG: formylglycine-generating enzyme family protein [Kiritimatiellae bacterium]|nr:formylglycine-generating enzyme family protein [Kiritimatiellia bacterium]
MRNAFMLLAVAAVFKLNAVVPSIAEGSVELKQVSGHGDMVVSYRLEGAPGIVTMDVQTNAGGTVWCSIEAAAFMSSVSGDVGHMVEVGERAIRWDVRKGWPDKVVPAGGIRAVLTAWATNAPPDWLAVDLKNEGVHWFCASEDMLPCGPVTGDAAKTDWLVLKRVKASGIRWVMGSSEQDSVRSDYEVPHFVTLTEDYYMGVYEFTQGQFMAVGGKWSEKYPNITNKPLRPVLGLTWGTIRGKYGWPADTRVEAHEVSDGSPLGKLRKLTGIDFDLPTEAQWEFACRAGCETPLYNGLTASAANADAIAYTPDNTPLETLQTSVSGVITESQEHIPQPVGGKLPNAWGFYDMLGNAAEFCLDYIKYYHSVVDAIDPVGPSSPDYGTARVRRGGTSGDGSSANCRCAHRTLTNQGASYYYNGFRVMCPITLKW